METRWSPTYLRRKELMETFDIPSISEVKDNAGLPLALVVFEQTHQELQKDLGVTPFLNGPRGELWVSPSDLLIGKVALKPPLTQKHIQALTHQGIIEIGNEIEEKFLNEKKMEKEREIEERANFLKRLFEAEKEVLIKEIRGEEKERYEEQMNQLRREFDDRVCQHVWECHEQIKALEEQLNIQFDSLNELWQARLEEEIQATVEKITEEFLEKLRVQEKVLVNIYEKQLKKLKMKGKCAVEFERTKCKEIMIQMKHKLHCQNVADLMYLICKERRKCKTEKQQMEKNHLSQIRKHNLEINKKANLINKLTRIKNKKIKQLQVRETCLKEILRQFQKFIYFALKATPTQGEFLLNIDKLIKFELNDYCISSPNLLEKSNTKTIEERPQKPVLDHFQIEEFLEASASRSEEFEESDALPAFYFNDKMYIREDFRDMISAGIEIDKKHSLWNPDVEELLNIFKMSIETKNNNCQLEKVKSHHSSVHFHRDGKSSDSTLSEIWSVSGITSRHQSPIGQLKTLKMSPHGSATRSISLEDEKEMRKVSLLGPADVKSKDGKKLGKKSSLESSGKDLRAPGSKTQSRLTLARDSVILHISTIERKSLQLMSKAVEETASKTSSDADKLKQLKAPESIQEEESIQGPEQDIKLVSNNDSKESQKGHFEGEEFDEEENDGSIHKPVSKLLLANDSYEIIKSTIAIVDKAPEKQEKRKSELTFNPRVGVSGSAIRSKSVGKKAKQVKSTKSSGGKKAATSKLVTEPAKITGSRKTKEHEKPIDEFTNERITSLVKVMKENPSLIRLFTPCSTK